MGWFVVLGIKSICFGVWCDEEFFNAIAVAYHQVMSFMAQTDPERLREVVDDSIRFVYENEAGINTVPDQDRWAIHTITAHLVYNEEIAVELAPIREYIMSFTEWGVPETYEDPRSQSI